MVIEVGQELAIQVGMLLFRSLVLGLLGACVLVEIAHLHTHLHDRPAATDRVVLLPPCDALDVNDAHLLAPVAQGMDDTVIVDIQRATIDRLLSDSNLAAQARLVPYFHSGQPHGYKLYAIRPGSVFAVLGLQNGDVLTTVNNQLVHTDVNHWPYTLPTKPAFFDLGVERAKRSVRIIVLIHGD